jgi:hypothetical protein
MERREFITLLGGAAFAWPRNHRTVHVTRPRRRGDRVKKQEFIVRFC